MVESWEPGTQYNHGDVVEYEGNEYKIIQPHFSQSDWTPNITPALWGKVPKSHHHGGGYQQQQQQQQYQQQQPQQQQYQQQPQQQQQYNQQPQNQPSYDSGKQEQGPQKSNDNPDKKGWVDEHKNDLLIGGGILAGLGVLGGGIAAYQHHENEVKAHQNFEAWANAARARRGQEPKGPAMWVYNEGKNIPNGAISTGTEHDWTLYICRAFMDGGVQIGKASNVFQEGAVIGYASKEHQIGQYEILVGDMRGLKWVQTGNRLNVQSLNATPVEGGYEKDGTPLYVARAYYEGAKHPGKASTKLEGAFIPYGGKEKHVKEYEVLCYA